MVPAVVKDHEHLNGELFFALNEAQVLVEPCNHGLREDGVEYATLEWVDWLNHRRLFEPTDSIPPAEFEEEYHRQAALQKQEALKQESLH